MALVNIMKRRCKALRFMRGDLFDYKSCALGIGLGITYVLPEGHNEPGNLILSVQAVTRMRYVKGFVQ
jgi:hypothetical protein